MNGETELLLGVWEAVRDHLPAAKRADAAEGVLRAMTEYGFTQADLSAIVEEDPDLADAFAEVFAGEDDEDDEEDH